ncbi:hypothetical protein Nepgr_014596 [Nepenthes gracilis]|uniref:ENTH domain-containing protein n=1 Tax=Nepenthes gracilis TaxID=150966 RepID=A0AAD3SJI4_NEPGR|nr:hypothetical protein Nepgr_014596 [Nepenthes gracilis]
MDMSISGSHSNSNMSSSTPFFHELKKHASFYIKEKIKTARLALMDVTPAQLLAEDATSGNPWAPDARTLGLISQAAFEVDDYCRIVDILHQKLSRFDKKNWRPSYKALIVLERLLTHGPESVAVEFQCEENVIREMQNFQHIDEKGFNWGLAVRRKSERILNLLEKGPLLKEERIRARNLTRGIEGFGSFSERISSNQEIPSGFGRSHSQFNEHGNQEDDSLAREDLDGDSAKQMAVNSLQTPGKEPENSQITRRRLEENRAPTSDTTKGDLHLWNATEEGESFLVSGRGEGNMGLLGEEDHPFYNNEKQSSVSLLADKGED